METNYFRINKQEYCHITEDKIFVVNSKEVARIPLESELNDSWGILSILNYIFFTLLLIYTAFSTTYYGIVFFKQPLNYATLFLLFVSFVRVKNGFMSSSTPTISRNKIKSVYFKTPKFSFPRLVVYFTGPEGKVLRRIIPVWNKKEALPVLKELGLSES